MGNGSPQLLSFDRSCRRHGSSGVRSISPPSTEPGNGCRNPERAFAERSGILRVEHKGVHGGWGLNQLVLAAFNPELTPSCPTEGELRVSVRLSLPVPALNVSC